MSGVELPAVIVARLALAEDRLELGELLHRGVGAQVLVALEAAERRDQVVEEARVVRRGEVLVRGDGELVLLLAADLPLQRGQGGVLAHRQPGARLAVLRDRRGRCRPGGSAPSAVELALRCRGAALTFDQLLAQLAR